MELALSALRANIDHLRLLESTSNSNEFKIKKYTLSQYLRLDVAAMKALNILPNTNDMM